MAKGRKLYDDTPQRARDLVEDKVRELREAEEEKHRIIVKSYNELRDAMEGIDDCEYKPPTKEECGTITITIGTESIKVVCEKPDHYLIDDGVKKWSQVHQDRPESWSDDDEWEEPEIEPPEVEVVEKHYALSEICEMVAKKVAKIEKDIGRKFQI
jgi:hypothetical protein